MHYDNYLNNLVIEKKIIEFINSSETPLRREEINDFAINLGVQVRPLSTLLKKNVKNQKIARLRHGIYAGINNNMMTEQQIQSKRIKELEAEGYYVIKLTITNKNGIPDLIAIPPNSNVLFSEIKRPNGKLSKLQEFRIKELQPYANTEIYRG